MCYKDSSLWLVGKTVILSTQWDLLIALQFPLGPWWCAHQLRIGGGPTVGYYQSPPFAWLSFSSTCPEGCNTFPRTEGDCWAPSEIPFLWFSWKLVLGFIWGNRSHSIFSPFSGITVMCCCLMFEVCSSAILFDFFFFLFFFFFFLCVCVFNLCLKLHLGQN